MGQLILQTAIDSRKISTDGQLNPVCGVQYKFIFCPKNVASLPPFPDGVETHRISILEDCSTNSRIMVLDYDQVIQVL